MYVSFCSARDCQAQGRCRQQAAGPCSSIQCVSVWPFRDNDHTVMAFVYLHKCAAEWMLLSVESINYISNSIHLGIWIVWFVLWHRIVHNLSVIPQKCLHSSVQHASIIPYKAQSSCVYFSSRVLSTLLRGVRTCRISCLSWGRLILQITWLSDLLIISNRRTLMCFWLWLDDRCCIRPTSCRYEVLNYILMWYTQHYINMITSSSHRYDVLNIISYRCLLYHIDVMSWTSYQHHVEMMASTLNRCDVLKIMWCPQYHINVIALASHQCDGLNIISMLWP